MQADVSSTGAVHGEPHRVVSQLAVLVYLLDNYLADLHVSTDSLSRIELDADFDHGPPILSPPQRCDRDSLQTGQENVTPTGEA